MDRGIGAGWSSMLGLLLFWSGNTKIRCNENLCFAAIFSGSPVWERTSENRENKTNDFSLCHFGFWFEREHQKHVKQKKG
jgi:hypothetical protein